MQCLLAIDRRPLKILLLVAALGFTVFFAPWAAFALFVGIDALLHPNSPDAAQFTWLSAVGCGGLLGLGGAWLRLLIPTDSFCSRPWLRRAVVICLCAGFATAVALSLGARGILDPWLYLYGASALLGLLLVASTVSLRHRVA